MEDAVENLNIGPAITIKSSEGVKVKEYPYQEQKERWGKRRFDVIMVFGQGPVKPVLLPKELTEEQRIQWEEFIRDPLHSREPDFRVIEGVFLQTLEEIQNRDDIPDKEKERIIGQKRQEWQRLGRLALNRWRRENALAAGLALYLGLTDKIILCGGKTRPKWAESTLPKTILDSWPSEAELMRDIIIRRFGRLYQEQYGKSIEEAIVIEDQSTNTLENIAYAINNDPSLRNSKNIAILGTHFHTPRIQQLMNIFSLRLAPRGQISAQDLLLERAQIRRMGSLEKQLNYMIDQLNNPDFRDRVLAEARWSLGLLDEEFLTYWLGYLGELDDLHRIHSVLKTLYQDENWHEEAKKAFQLVGLNFDEFAKMTLEELQNPEVWKKLKDALLKLKKEYRTMPPDLREKK